jgi:hypothetical protein
VFVNDDFAHPVLTGVAYPEASGYLAVPGGAYNVKVTPAGNPGVIVIDADVDLAAGTRYSVYAAGPLAAIAPYVLTDDNRPIAVEGKVRIVHLAPSAGLVDIYVSAPGADILTASPAFAGVDFEDETGYVGLTPGTYDVTVTAAGTKTVAIGPATITATRRASTRRRRGTPPAAAHPSVSSCSTTSTLEHRQAPGSPRSPGAHLDRHAAQCTLHS